MISNISGALPMKIDMSKEAVTQRLKIVAQLRSVCLSLAGSSAGKKVREQFPDNETVRRTSRAMPAETENSDDGGE